MPGYKTLLAYQKAKQVADAIFLASKKFPIEERYSLTDQIRRSSRAVCACMGEAYRKRKYPAHFVSKLTDSDMENGETEVWLDFAKDCSYLKAEEYQTIYSQNEEVAKLLAYMINHPEKFL
ncbi:MAG: four helix bundle protein [Chitinophagaceae bacterium]|jgi:four helix bundle protein|nr:four helix bundle protein [Chitinophagaceae bacterium]